MDEFEAIYRKLFVDSQNRRVEIENARAALGTRLRNALEDAGTFSHDMIDVIVAQTLQIYDYQLDSEKRLQDILKAYYLR